MIEKIAVSWSGGKDCSLALCEIVMSGQFEVHSLHTSFNEESKRVGLHGVRQKLIELQADSIGLQLDKIYIPSSGNHAAYETSMKNYFQSLASIGIKRVVFGDIFLEDLKLYREKMLSQCGLEGIFPLWKSDSLLVAEKFIGSGFKALICSADSKYFKESSVGLDYDQGFINSLNEGVDPCGENGEFHTFVYDGPIFKKPISVQRKQIEVKEYAYKVNLPNGQSESRTSKFWFQELE